MAELILLLSVGLLQWISLVASDTMCITGNRTTYEVCSLHCSVLNLDAVNVNCTETRWVNSPDYKIDLNRIDLFMQIGNIEVNNDWFPVGNHIKSVILAGNNITLLKLRDFKNLQLSQRIAVLACNVISYESFIFNNWDLIEIDFSANFIVDIAPFGNLPLLQELILNDNDIEILRADAFINYTTLLELHLTVNNIRVIEPCTFCALTKLNSLFLDYNRLTSLPPNFTKGMRHLKLLTLQNNEITEITSNIFTELNPTLRTLKLDDNLISSIEPMSFAKLKHLKSLHLSGNVLTTIHENSFKGLRSIKVLDLDENRIACLSESLLVQFKSIRGSVKVSMKNNVWICACKTEVDVVFRKRGVTKYTNGGKCVE